jgi:fatty acid desaturase
MMQLRHPLSALTNEYDSRRARNSKRKEAGSAMFLILAIVLVALWLGGFVMFKSAGFLIHLLLIFAVISLVMHFVTGRRTV